MSAIGLRGVVKAWGATRAVDGVSFEASAGRFVVLLGPSGCGKSTTLRLIAGLEQVSAGRVFIGDADVTDLAPAKRQISMVFQSYALFPHLSVAENIVFGLRVRRLPAAERKARLARVAALLGLDQLLGRKPSQLSGGQQQRVALGRAIIAEAPVCLMDEPLSNLDAQLRQEMRREIRALQQQLGITMVYVTHDQVEAMTMATRIAVMKDGVLQQLDSPQSLYDKPNNVFVAGFIGSPAMNFFDAKLARNDGKLTVDTGAFAVDVPAAKAATYESHVGRAVVLGIRPEDIHDPNWAPPGIHEALIPTKVEVTELMGNEVFLYLKSGDKSYVARVDPRTQARIGHDVTVAINMDNMHLFDKETEQAIR